MKTKNQNYVLGSGLLLVAAMIWGVTLVAQDMAMDHMGPLAFSMLRMAIASLVLLPPAILSYKNDIKTQSQQKKSFKIELLVGLLCGTMLFLGLGAQQLGLSLYPQTAASVGKAGFISSLYIVFVPVFGVFSGKKAGASVWTGVLVALAGMYLLCITASFTIETADVLMVFSAIFVALQILFIGRFSGSINGYVLSFAQFAVSGFLFFIAMLFTKETLSWESIKLTLIPLLCVGVLSSGVGYTFQIIAQRHVGTVIASLLLSTESVFAALAGWLLLKQTLSHREMLGCLLVFAAVILCSVTTSKKEKAASKNFSAADTY